jgi:predicted Zn-dependent protease
MARTLFDRGRYAEALAAAEALEADEPIGTKLLRAEVLFETGQADDGYKLLLPLLEQAPRAEVARTAAVLLDRRWTQHEAIKRLSARLLELDPNDLVGQWLTAKQQLQAAKYDEAKTTLAWFAKEPTRHKPASLEEALALARGLVEHARWSRESRWFDMAVNQVLADAEKQWPSVWRLPLERSRVFSEKHNEPAAVDALNAALAKNASAAEIHVLRARFAADKFDTASARRALAQAQRINASLPEIPLIECDLALAELQPEKVPDILQRARNDSAHNGVEYQGRLLAAEAAQLRPADQTAKQGNAPVVDPRCYIVEGEAYERMRHFGQAAAAYRRAFEKLPEHPGLRGLLGQQLLRLGEEEEGATLLAAAYREDPFDVRLKNSLAVLDVLATYATIETEHFLVRFDRGRDEVLARYVADELEQSIFPDLKARFGYAPSGKMPIEIYNQARNTSGHGWFSARMVGVPGLHTIAACGGRVVALASPTDMPRPYHWKRVLRHECVHLFNLDQTAYHVPHWVTEGLAVRAENRPRPGSWMRLLTQRWLDDDLFTLDDINFGFIRPQDSDDWTCAYAQAELCIEYLEAACGPESVHRLLAAFAENRSTPEAVSLAAGMPAEKFEQAYREFLKKQVESWNLASATPRKNIEQLQKHLATDPRSAELLAALALAHFGKEELPLARKFALQSTALEPKNATAAYVLASLAAKSGDSATATRLAQAALDPQSPHEGLLLLLADLKFQAKQNAVAEKLVLLGKKRFPGLEQWNERLVRLYSATKDDEKLEPVLTELWSQREDDASVPAKLLELAGKRGDQPAAERWAKATLAVDVRHAPSHAVLAEAHTAANDHPAARREWEAAIASDDKHPNWQLALAKTCLKLGDRDRARQILERLADTSPSLPGLVEAAQELRP